MTRTGKVYLGARPLPVGKGRPPNWKDPRPPSNGDNLRMTEQPAVPTPPAPAEEPVIVPPPPSMSSEFQALHEAWSLCLAGEDRNTIHRQVLTMIWNAAAFRVVNEARRLAPKEDDGALQANGLMHQLLDHCFFESQLIAVRRLLDGEKMAGDHGVYSLRSLIRDMRKNRHLLTRGNMFAAASLPTDLNAVSRAADAEIRRMVSTKPGEAFYLQTVDPGRVAELHRVCDQLCGISDPKRRALNDQVSDAVFVGLARKLDSLAPVITAVNKLVAHAATIHSRSSVNPAELTVTFGQLWRAHETICRCCHFIDCYLLRHNTMQFLAMPSYNVLTYMEIPLAVDAVKPELEKVWQEYEAETGTWTDASADWATAP